MLMERLMTGDFMVPPSSRQFFVGLYRDIRWLEKTGPWFWTITAREIPPSVHNHEYSATREQAMADFKMRWGAT
jgi:hypothetical protein